MPSKIFYWLPRILMVLSLLFMAMFSLDSFGGHDSFGRKMLGLLIHNIPVLILALLLVLAWYAELAGGILIILASVVGMIFYRSFTGNPGSLVVILPFFLEGGLFVLHGIMFKSRKI